MQSIPVELIVPIVRTEPVRPTRPRYFWVFAVWMSLGAFIAAAAGTVLGILAATEVSIGAERWTQSVQAHGRLQLFGFIAPFIATLFLEFLPRLNGTRVTSAKARLLVPGLLAVGAIASGTGTLVGGGSQPIALTGTVLFAAGALGLAIVSFGERPLVATNVDPQPLFLRSAASWLIVAAGLSLWFTVRADSGVTELDGSRATLEIFLRGFVMLTIIGVGLRVFVGHLGLHPMDRFRQRLILAATNASIAVWLLGQGLGPLPEFSVFSRLGDFGFAFSLLLLTYWLGIIETLRRPGRREVYEFLVPVAWAALVIYAAAVSLLAVSGYGGLSTYQQGAIRHLFLLGFVVPLMVAVAHIVLARFGTGEVKWEPALTIAFILLVAAWPMRVIPALIADAPGTVAQSFLGLAGLLTIASLVLVSVVCVRTAILCRRSQ